MLAKIKMLTGVVEVGIFCHMIKAAYFGNQAGLFLVLRHCTTKINHNRYLYQDGSVTVRWDNGKIEQVIDSSAIA